MSLVIERVQGAAIERHLPALAALRIAVFREYPYLYAGDLEYEHRYLAHYAASSTALVVLAREDERVVGAATAMPLLVHSDNVVPPLVAAGYEPARVFYFGESVLDPVHRGRGLGNAFFIEREHHARTHGFETATFCAVERAGAHPAGYRPLHPLWEKHGFVRRPDIATTFSWRDLDAAEETPKSMVFWTKELR